MNEAIQDGMFPSSAQGDTPARGQGEARGLNIDKCTENLCYVGLMTVTEM